MVKPNTSTVTIDINDNTATIKGELSFATVLAIRQAGINFIRRLPAIGIIDLSAVNKADSAGVALLLEWWRCAEKTQKTIQFTQFPPAILALITLCGLTEIL